VYDFNAFVRSGRTLYTAINYLNGDANLDGVVSLIDKNCITGDLWGKNSYSCRRTNLLDSDDVNILDYNQFLKAYIN